MNTLIIRPGALGDTLMLLPALGDLQGKTTITYVGRQPGLHFIEDYVHLAMDLEGPGWHRLFMKSPDNHLLPVSQAELVVAFFTDEDGTIRNNLNLTLPHVPAYVFPSFPSEVEDVHVARYLSECLKSAGLPVDPERSIETILTRGLPQKMDLPARQDTVVFHPGSGDPKKNHSPQLWLELVGRLGQEIDLQSSRPILLLGPAEASLYPLFREALHPLKAEIRFCPDKDTLLETLKRAILYLGQDSGVTHLSAMLGTPTVALFKETNVHQWRPLGPYVKVVRQKQAGPELVSKALKASMSFFSQPPSDH